MIKWTSETPPNLPHFGNTKTHVVYKIKKEKKVCFFIPKIWHNTGSFHQVLNSYFWIYTHYFKLCPIGGAVVHLSADIVTDIADILLLAAPSSSFPRNFSSCGLCCRPSISCGRRHIIRVFTLPLNQVKPFIPAT